MNRNAMRSFGIFAAVIVVLAGLTIGGVYFAKDRSQAYEPQTQDEVQEETAKEEVPQEQEENTSTEENDVVAAELSEAEEQVDSEVDTIVTDTEVDEENVQEANIASTGQEVPETGVDDNLLLSVPLFMAVVFLIAHLIRGRLSLVQQLLS